jgi:hypothetical protein
MKREFYLRGRTCGAILALLAMGLAGCGGDDGGMGNGGNGGNGQGTMPTSDIGTVDGFVAWENPVSGAYAVNQTGSYAGKRQMMRGTIDPLSGLQLGQLAGVEFYKYEDGHVYALDLTTSSTPAPQQVSSESAATIDDTCSLDGLQAGGNTDYLGVSFVPDVPTPTNSRYFYRLPGVDGVCDTPDDVIQMVSLGLPSGSAPTTVAAMPVAGLRDAYGSITGFVAKSGASLALYDSNFLNPVTLGTFGANIGVATVLPVGGGQSYVPGQLYIVDGNIVYVNYAAPSVSAPLFTIPNWSATDTGAVFAASPDTLYFAINTPAAGATPASATLYSMPADGSAAPTALFTQAGRILDLQFPYLGASLVYSGVDVTYSVYALAQGTSTPVTLTGSPGNGGRFVATPGSVYYTDWVQTNTLTSLTRTGTQSGIVGIDGSVVEPPVANSAFASGGEYSPWPLSNGGSAGPIVTETPLVTVFQVQYLSPVTVSDSTTGVTYTIDGVSGGTVLAIDTTSNQVVATVGTVPTGTATFLNAAFRSSLHEGFITASTYLSTADPATEDSYFIGSYQDNSLFQVTSNL